MKKFMLLTALVAFTTAGFSSNKYDGDQRRKKHKMALKTHVCTAACKDGKHVYLHGEKGHVCGPECKMAKM